MPFEIELPVHAKLRFRREYEAPTSSQAGQWLHVQVGDVWFADGELLSVDLHQEGEGFRACVEFSYVLPRTILARIPVALTARALVEQHGYSEADLPLLVKHLSALQRQMTTSR